MNNAFLLLPVLSFCVIYWLEGVTPHIVRNNNRGQHSLSNLAVAIVDTGITIAFILCVTRKVMNWASLNGIGLLNRAAVSGVSKLAAGVILFDLWMYFWHRLNHRFFLFWLLHRAHHNDIDMDVTTALRFHPFEIIISNIFNLGIVALVGLNLEQLLLYNALLQLIIFFHHSNVGLPEKWDRLLRSLIVTPNMHRVHHSIEMKETNSNYSGVFSVWDRIYSTFRKRDDTRGITYGLNIFRGRKWQGLRGCMSIPFEKGS